MTLSAAEAKVCLAVDARRHDMFQLLATAVAIPTGHGHALGLDECRGLFLDRLRALGAAIRTIPGDPRPPWLADNAALADTQPPPTAVAFRLSGAGPRILLCGHIDTVHDPRGAFNTLIPSPDGSRATGPGCADMKGGIVVALAALEALADAGALPRWSFILNSDEETGSYASDRALRAEAAQHDVGLVFEPALPDGALVIERPGSGQFAIEARGRAAHVGRDFRAGVNAIAALAHAVTRISAHADPDAGKIVNVGVVRGGSATNIVPDSAWAWGNVRFSSPAAEAELAGAIDGLAGPSGGGEVRVMRSFARPAKPTTDAVRALAELARACAADLGQSLPFGKTGGVCDGNNLQAAGIAVIDTLGVRGGGLHTTDEWVELASLADRAKLAALLMMRLSEGWTRRG